MKTLFLALVLITGNAFAYGYKKTTESFVVSSFTNDGSRVYYNCDSVEYATIDMLEQLGAKNVSARCSGGINQWGYPTEAFVRATFEVLSSEVDGNLSTAIHDEDFNSHSNCHLNTQIFKGVQKSFEILSYNLGSCFRSNDRTRLSVEVIKEDI